MRSNIRNNVHVNGGEIKRSFEGKRFVELQLDSVPVTIQIPIKQWEKFSSEYPNAKKLSVFGVLNKLENVANSIRVVNDNSIGLVHNILEDENEPSINFNGAVKLIKKFPFNTASKLYLMRMIFETVDYYQARFEATAVRSFVPYFEIIPEGTTIELKARLITDEKNTFPYWKVTNQPKILKISPKFQKSSG